MTHHTRHLRGAIGSREHFDWAANGDSLRELEPVIAQESQPIVGTGLGWVVPMAFVLGVALTIVGANSGASPSGTEALVLTDQAPTGLAASRVDPLAGDAK